MCHSELKDYESCIFALDKCLKLNEHYAKAYMKRGETNMLLEDYEEAIQDFNQGRDLQDPMLEKQFKLKVDEALKIYKKYPLKDLYKILNI